MAVIPIGFFMTILVTGGLGFIGSNFIRKFLEEETDEYIINIDNVTYAARHDEPFLDNSHYNFYQLDIQDRLGILNVLSESKPRALVNFAAETHVDRSISNSDVFIKSNILGVYSLLEAVREYLGNDLKHTFKFVHISTDEVFGSLGQNDSRFTEESQYKPNSPYSASKASSDHLVRSWFHTYRIPTIITNCSNNYGPFQYPEKLIPVVISNAVKRKNIPIYGDGKNIRDWVHVSDHCDAIKIIINSGSVGESYCIGGNSELSNINLVNKICSILDSCLPINNGSYRDLITFIDDRPGHDFRYAINSEKIKRDLGWYPKIDINSGLESTVLWYINNMSWLKDNDTF